MRARIAAAALAAVMTVGMGMPAWAGHSEITTNGKVGSSEESTFTYAGVKGGTTTFDKYLVINQPSYKATVPNVTFSFSIAPGTAIAADAEKKTMAVYAGGDGTTSTGTPTISGEGKATFSPDDIEDIAEEAGATQDKTISFKTESDTDESYASKMMTVDFSGVTFKEPGIYRWIITETAVNDVTGISNDDDLDRTLDVYVSDKNDGTGTLEVKSYVLHEGTEAPAANATKESNATTIDASNTDKKSTGFTNYYDTYEIVIGKEVTGNEASRDKYFKLTLQVKGDFNEADKFYVDSTGFVNYDSNPTKTAATIYEATTMATANRHQEEDASDRSYTGAELKNGIDVYLKHGQYMGVYGLPKGATYTVTEAAEDYKSTTTAPKVEAQDFGDTTGTEPKHALTDDTNGELTKNIYTGYTNEKTGTIPTGVLLTIFPYAMAAIGAGAIGAGVSIHNRRRREEDEDEEE